MHVQSAQYKYIGCVWRQVQNTTFVHPTALKGHIAGFVDCMQWMRSISI